MLTSDSGHSPPLIIMVGEAIVKEEDGARARTPMNVLTACTAAESTSSMQWSTAFVALFALFVLADVFYTAYTLSRIVRASEVKSI